MNRGCDFFADALVEKASGGLDPERATRLDAHLKECADCEATLRTVNALKALPLDVPTGLEARIAASVKAARIRPAGDRKAAIAVGADRSGRGPEQHRRGVQWRPWALPLAAAAAAAAIWLGVGAPGLGNGDGAGSDLAVFEEYDPWGAWPADGLVVAGQPMLSELSVEELEDLLRELET